MPVNGKAKGNNGERILAKILSEYLGGSFVRVPNSGAFIGGKNQTRKDTLSVTQIRSSKGDIIPPDDYPNLVVECKFYKDIAYHSLAVDQNVALLDTWIKELEYDCDENDFGILCFKTNNRKWQVSFHTKYLHKFKVGIHIVYGEWIITGLETFLTHNQAQIKALSNGDTNE